MYERGDTAMIESLLGSADMTDFLNRVEYVSDVYEYDRNLLTQYQITVQQVADLKVSVETEKAELEAMQEEYGQQQASLETILAQKRSQMGSYDNQLATAQAAADEFKQTIAAQNQIIKEEERKQREAEKAAEAAAKAAAAAAKANKNSNSSGKTEASQVHLLPIRELQTMAELQTAAERTTAERTAAAGQTLRILQISAEALSCLMPANLSATRMSGVGQA